MKIVLDANVTVPIATTTLAAALKPWIDRFLHEQLLQPVRKQTFRKLKSNKKMARNKERKKELNLGRQYATPPRSTPQNTYAKIIVDKMVRFEPAELLKVVPFEQQPVQERHRKQQTLVVCLGGGGFGGALLHRRRGLFEPCLSDLVVQIAHMMLDALCDWGGGRSSKRKSNEQIPNLALD